MPTKIEKDALTGVETTGHEWDGIQELNNPLPKWWLYVFFASIIYAVVWVVLYDAIPFWNSHSQGLLGTDQRTNLERSMAAARERQAEYYNAIEAASVEEILGDPDLLTFAQAGGGAAFADNCAGQAGVYPVLADDEWIWGGDLQAIKTSIQHGIRNNDDPEARQSMMPAFDYLPREDINAIANYVASLSGEAEDQSLADKGQELYQQNCAACHGEDAKGQHALGAPNLTDAIWLYGGGVDNIRSQLINPQHGVMPPWQGRLDESTIKMLTVYVHQLGGGQ